MNQSLGDDGKGIISFHVCTMYNSTCRDILYFYRRLKCNTTHTVMGMFDILYCISSLVRRLLIILFYPLLCALHADMSYNKFLDNAFQFSTLIQVGVFRYS